MIKKNREFTGKKKEVSARQWVMENGPQFMIIGAAKSGTTTLYSYLDNHPDLYLSKKKEPEFFSEPNKYELGYEWYKNQFISAPIKSIKGEASTTYSRWPHTLDSPKLIYENSRVNKFIYIMRDPVERAYSHYAHMMRTGVTMSFEEALKKHDILFDTGNYYMQLERYLQYFSIDDFLFLTLEQFKLAPERELSRILTHINASPFDFAIDQVERCNKRGNDYYLRYLTIEKWKKNAYFLKLLPIFPRKLRDCIFQAMKKSLYGKKLISDYKLDPMKAETKLELRNQYKELNNKLTELTGVDISVWGE